MFRGHLSCSDRQLARVLRRLSRLRGVPSIQTSPLKSGSVLWVPSMRTPCGPPGVRRGRRCSPRYFYCPPSLSPSPSWTVNPVLGRENWVSEPSEQTLVAPGAGLVFRASLPTGRTEPMSKARLPFGQGPSAGRTVSNSISKQTDRMWRRNSSCRAQRQGRLGRQPIRVNKCLTYQTASIR